jgi:hypothetical protein
LAIRARSTQIGPTIRRVKTPAGLLIPKGDELLEPVERVGRGIKKLLRHALL